MCERGIYGPKVASDPAGGAAYGAVGVGHRYVGGRRMDLLDAAGGDALCAQQQAGGNIEPGVQTIVDGCERTLG